MNIIKSMSLIMLLSIAGVASAQLDKTLVITPVKGKQAINVYADFKGEIPYTVALRNDEGVVLWSEKWEKPVYAKSVLLKTFPEGSYVVSIEGNERYTERSFSLDSNGAIIEKGQRTILGPTISVMDNAVLVDFDVAYGSPVDPRDVDVTIYDEFGKEVFANNITNDHGRITKYDMSILPGGHYEMVFNIEGKSFTRSVRIK